MSLCISVYLYLYIYIYIYLSFYYLSVYLSNPSIHLCTFCFVNSIECSTLGENISFLKKRCLYTTKVSCYLQSGILFVLCSRNDKNICQKLCLVMKYNSRKNTKDRKN